MAIPSKQGKKLIEYNCKNGVYNLGGSDSTIKPLGYLTAVTLEKNSSTKDIYGDGELVLSVLRDKGSTGTLEMTVRDDDFEKDLGFLQEIEQGLAEVQILRNANIAVGFECYITKADGTTITKKVWLLGVQVAPAGDSLAQNTDDTNEATASYGLTVKGVNLQAASGTGDYVDSNGNTKKVYKISCLPTDSNYATFFDTVPVPKAKA